ncbi:MAG TPA: hypothetical protein VMG99_05430 [Thermoplasmata archaeon]|nr:hypothetical protein [Thermoplasmata archaeon]
MPNERAGTADLRRRLAQLTTSGKALEKEGLPFPTDQIHDAVEDALELSDLPAATAALKRGEALLARVAQDWTWVRELLRRADELRAIAATIGVDVQHLDARVGNPRARLQTDGLSSGSLEKAAASASLALAVLNDAVPKFCVQEAQALGDAVRRARNRGEEVREATRSFSRLIQAIQDQNLPTAAQRLVEARKAVARIPRAPALPAISPHEEEEILLEARNLARRLQRIKGKARDAQSAARLMAQVRQALSEDRRFGTPEEEIEQLWLEVDRLTKERKLATTEVPGLGEEAVEGLEEGAAPASPEEALDEAIAAGDRDADDASGADEHPDEEPEEIRPLRSSLLVPYLPPDDVGLGGIPPGQDSPDAAGRGRSRRLPRP